MNVDLFITCYKHDLPWLRWLLTSAEKHLTGHRDIIVVYCGEMSDLPSITGNPICPNVRPYVLPERQPGHMHQQVLKMTADKFVPPDCDWICMIDSDCFFHRPTDVSSLFVDGKPIWRFTDWGSDDQWRHGSEEVLGVPIRYNFMHSQGMCFKPNHLEGLRENIIDSSDHYYVTEFDDIILGRWDPSSDWKFPDRGGLPTHTPGKPTMSDFVVMGGNQWRYHHDDYTWIHMEAHRPAWPAPEPDYSFVRQYWSHSGITPEIREEMLEALR